MRTLMRRVAWLGMVALWVSTGCDGAGTDLRGDAGDPSDSVRLSSIVVARVLHDFPSLPDKQWSKVEAFFDGDLAHTEPTQIASVLVDGPGGFHTEIASIPFQVASSGYVQNRELGGFWYQVLLPGFLAEGRYQVTVVWRDGRRERLARTLRDDAAMLDFYLAHKADLRYAPPSAAPADDVTLSWSTLADLGGPDAYYNVWISPGTAEAIDPISARGDTIFEQALRDPSAGKNKDHLHIASAENPLSVGPHTWQPEILDSNILDEVNLIIFPAGRHLDLY